MAIDVLELQLVSALQRFANLQRRAGSDRDHEKLLERVLQELESALEEVRVAQDQLVEGRHRLEAAQAEVTKERQRYWRLFDEMPQPYLVTEPNSVITEVNRAAAQLFNVSQRFLVGKAMSVFVCEDRDRFLTAISDMSAGARSGELSFKLRPRERAPLDVVAAVGADASGLRWVLRPAVAAVAVQH
jgi:PAS domain-containing protein